MKELFSAAAPASMWHHARLLRRVLLLVSVMTLSGVHVQRGQLPGSWRAARLVPTTLCSISAIAKAVHIAKVTSNGYQLMYSLTIDATYVQGFLSIIFLVWYRRRLHGVLRHVTALNEATATCRRPGDNKNVLRQSVFLFSTMTCALINWTIAFFIMAELEHPHYFSNWQPPVALQHSPWYSLVNAFQIAVGIIAIINIIAFDILMGGLIDALAVLQDRLCVFCERYLSSSNEDGVCVPRQLHESVDEVRVIFTNRISPETEGSSVPNQQGIHVKAGENLRPWTTKQETTAGRSSDPGATLSDITQSVPKPNKGGHPLRDLEFHLQQMIDTYASVRRLGSDAASVCSLPTLSLHACVTVGLLLGSYVSILMYHTDVATRGEMIGFAVFHAVTTLRLMIVSCAGSRLIQKGKQLHQTLAAVRWQAPVSSSARFNLQLLLEQTRQPLAFDGWGLFTVQKSNMVALFSFVLTYFVILIQMRVG